MSLTTRALIHERQRGLWRGPSGYPHIRDAGGVVHVVNSFYIMPGTSCGRIVGFGSDWIALSRVVGPLGPDVVNTWDAVSCMSCLAARGVR